MGWASTGSEPHPASDPISDPGPGPNPYPNRNPCPNQDVIDLANRSMYPGGKAASYPDPPPTCLHGAGNYVGWTSTNGFARIMTIAYDSLALFGEAKHGFWQWAVPAADAQAPIIWWCQLGGNSDASAYASGHADDGTPAQAGTQAGMEAIWEHLGRSPAANDLGPLAVRARLGDIALTAVRVHHVTGGRTWTNRGNAPRPYWLLLREEASVEVYVFEGYFKYPAMFDAEPCREGESNRSNCPLLNTFICLVTERAETEDVVGLTGSGLHYGPEADPCPDRCGAVECKCNAMLFDLALSGFLSSQFTDPLGFLPVWINPWLGPPAAASEGGGSGISASGGASTPREVWLLVVTAAAALVLGLLVGFGAAAWFYRRPPLSKEGQVSQDSSRRSRRPSLTELLAFPRLSPSPTPPTSPPTSSRDSSSLAV
eukprot:scaffold80688_cov54-Phaeocystis_antarctica.AAC.2